LSFEEEDLFKPGMNQEFKKSFTFSNENLLIYLKNLDYFEDKNEIISLLCFLGKENQNFFVQTKEGFFQLQEIYGSNENEVDFSEECVVCLTNDREIILLPCRHNCSCHTCFLHLDKCPICRSVIKAFIVLKPPTVVKIEEIEKELNQVKVE
jgi:hypothetical protein